MNQPNHLDGVDAYHKHCNIVPMCHSIKHAGRS